MPNRFTPIPPGTSQEQANAITNVNFGQLDNENVKKLFYGTDGLPSVLIDGATPVIKVAPPGVDVTNAPDSDLYFNTSQNIFKIIRSDTVTVSKGTNSSFAEVSVPHRLSFTPAVIAYVGDGISSYQPTPYLGLHVDVTSNNYLGIGVWASFSVDSTNINFTINTGTTGSDYSAALSLTFKYFVLQESAS